MTAMLRWLPALAGLAVLAAVCAEVAGHRAFTGYGEFEGLRLPASGKALYKLPGGDLDYIGVTITGLYYDTAPAPEQEAP